MSQPGQFSFSRRNGVFLGVCLGGLALLVLASLLPLRSQHILLDQKIATLQDELTNQRQNQTSIALVDGVVAQIDQQPGPQVVAIVPLAQDKTGQIIADIRAMAQESALALKAVAPLLDNQNSWQTMTVRAELHGAVSNLQPFLLKLLSLPYVKQIERLEIHPGGSGLAFSLTYTIVLA
jgi:hypothetical protein